MKKARYITVLVDPIDEIRVVETIRERASLDVVLREAIIEVNAGFLFDHPFLQSTQTDGYARLVNMAHQQNWLVKVVEIAL